MTDPRYIPPSDREGQVYATADERALLDHAVFMDERDARQRDLIRRLADALDDVVQLSVTYTGPGAMENCARLVAEARGVEATNE